MEYCKYCKKEMSNDGDFCGNCGAIKFHGGEDISKSMIKQFGYIFTNPVTFIRTSTYANLIFTAFTAMMIILIEFIIIQGMGKKLDIEISSIDAIITTLIITCIFAFCMFGIVKWIFKKNVIFMSFLNLTLSVQLILIITNIIGAILGVIIHPYMFTAFIVFGIIMYLLLIYQGIKDLIKANVMLYLVTIIGSFCGTSFMIFIILRMLLKNALQSML